MRKREREKERKSEREKGKKIVLFFLFKVEKRSGSYATMKLYCDMFMETQRMSCSLSYLGIEAEP